MSVNNEKTAECEAAERPSIFCCGKHWDCADAGFRARKKFCTSEARKPFFAAGSCGRDCLIVLRILCFGYSLRYANERTNERTNDYTARADFVKYLVAFLCILRERYTGCAGLTVHTSLVIRIAGKTWDDWYTYYNLYSHRFQRLRRFKLIICKSDNIVQKAYRYICVDGRPMYCRHNDFTVPWSKKIFWKYWPIGSAAVRSAFQRKKSRI